MKNAIYASTGALPAVPEESAPAVPCLRDLGDCPRGVVTSPGGIVIYRDYTGNIYLAR